MQAYIFIQSMVKAEGIIRREVLSERRAKKKEKEKENCEMVTFVFVARTATAKTCTTDTRI